MADDGGAREGSGQKEADSSGDSRGLWRNLKSFIFGNEPEGGLRKELEEAIAEYEEDAQESGQPDAQGDLSRLERQMLRNLLHFNEKDADDVAVPRRDIIAIEEQASFAELSALFAEAGHSRIPVYRQSLDTVIGMVHIRDAFAILARGETPPDTIEPLIRQPLFVPKSMEALQLLADMRAKRTHLAIVVDEYFATDGIVTIEDVIEEIFGEIEDEHDEPQEELLLPLDNGCWEADGRAELDDAAERIDPALGDEEDIDTLGGLAFMIAGHVPEPGEVLLHDGSGWRLEVLEADGKRINRIRLHPPEEATAEETEE